MKNEKPKVNIFGNKYNVAECNARDQSSIIYLRYFLDLPSTYNISGNKFLTRSINNHNMVLGHCKFIHFIMMLFVNLYYNSVILYVRFINILYLRHPFVMDLFKLSISLYFT